jgi:hypothetical protein
MSADLLTPVIGGVYYDGVLVEFTDREEMDRYAELREAIVDDRAWRETRVRRADFHADELARRELQLARDHRFDAQFAQAFLGGECVGFHRYLMRCAALRAVNFARGYAWRAGR